LAKRSSKVSAPSKPSARLNHHQRLAWLRLIRSSAGTNNLLKQGACLVTSARDIIETLAPILGRPPVPPPIELAAADEHRTPEPVPDIRQSERELIVAALGPSPVDIDDLIRATGVGTRKVHIVLLELDLAGPLQRHGQQLVSLQV
jgi:DNA processing protein